MQRTLSFLAALACTLVFTANASAQPKSATHFLPGAGVADPAGKIGYFPSEKGGIDALDLATGKLLWGTDGGGRPLLATDSRLFVQKGAAIHVLDTANQGKLVLDAKPLGFPDWVAVEPAYGRSFRSSARLKGKSLLLTWEARAFYAGGARPTREIEEAARKEVSGVARIDLDTGKIEALDAAKITAGKFFPMPGDAPNPRAGAVTLTVKDGPAKNAKNPFQQRRTLQAMNAANEMVWQRDIAAPIFLPPRP